MNHSDGHVPPAGPGARPPVALCAYTWLLVGLTLFLILSGGQVTSTDSGDAVDSWPLPIRLPMRGGVFFELGHRHVAGTVGCATLLLLVLLASYRRRLRSGTLRLGVVAAALVLLQAVLGGLRVLVASAQGTNEAAVVVAIGVGHALLGQSFFALLVCLAHRLSRRRDAPPLEARAAASADLRRVRSFAHVALGVAFLQLFLGALLRLTRPGPVPTLVLLHVVGALLVALAVIELVFRAARVREALPRVARLAHVAATLLGLQILLGFAAFFAVKDAPSPAPPELNWRTVLPTLHQATGAIFIATLALVVVAVRRRLACSIEQPSAAAGVLPTLSQESAR